MGAESRSRLRRFVHLVLAKGHYRMTARQDPCLHRESQLLTSDFDVDGKGGRWCPECGALRERGCEWELPKPKQQHCEGLRCVYPHDGECACPCPKCSPLFREGDCVSLLCGGLPMTVSKVFEYAVECVWQDTSGSPHRFRFEAHVLVKEPSPPPVISINAALSKTILR
jgi:uncharacterized protein YodC (DUF2158 family)